MNALAERFAEQGVGSIFLYTNEAHPGENYPHLTSMEQKYRHAGALRDIYGVTRPIMLDALDGAKNYSPQETSTKRFLGKGLSMLRCHGLECWSHQREGHSVGIRMTIYTVNS